MIVIVVAVVVSIVDVVCDGRLSVCAWPMIVSNRPFPSDPIHPIHRRTPLFARPDKLDSSFSRSRSSSMCSLENVSAESVTCLAFADSYTRKSGEFGSGWSHARVC